MTLLCFIPNDTTIDDDLRQGRVNEFNSKLNTEQKASIWKHRKMAYGCGKYILAKEQND